MRASTYTNIFKFKTIFLTKTDSAQTQYSLGGRVIDDSQLAREVRRQSTRHKRETENIYTDHIQYTRVQ